MFHEWPQPVFGHVGDQVVEHAALTEQGMGSGPDSVGLEMAIHAEALAGGDFTPLREWLKANVHAKGSLLEADDLLTAATGRPLEADVFRRHLRARYIAGEGV